MTTIGANPDRSVPAGEIQKCSYCGMDKTVMDPSKQIARCPREGCPGKHSG